MGEDWIEAKRLSLHNVLLRYIPNVYYQPITNVKLKYPALIYNINKLPNVKADNVKYLKHIQFTLTYITKDVVDPITSKLNELPMCEFDRHYISDNLHHNVFTIYY